MESKMNEFSHSGMESVSGGQLVIRPITEADIRSAAIDYKRLGYYKELLVGVLNNAFPGMKTVVKEVADELFGL